MSYKAEPQATFPYRKKNHGTAVSLSREWKMKALLLVSFEVRLDKTLGYKEGDATLAPVES